MEDELKLCSIAAARGEYDSLITLAKSAIAVDRTCNQAWDHLIVGLFALRDWNSLKTAITSALQVPSVSKQRSAHLSHISRAASIVQRLSTTGNKNSTQLLFDGWYKSRLTSLLEDNLLPEVDKYSDECVIIDTPGDNSNADYFECMHFSKACRWIGQNELLGFPLDQASNRQIFLKDRVLQLRCEEETDEEEEGEEDEEEEPRDYPMPKFLFPCLELCVPPDCEVFEEEELNVQVLHNALEPEVLKLIQIELDKLATERPDSPAPSYVNIIDPNVGVHNDFWVPIDVRVEQTSAAEVLAPMTLFGRKANGGMFPSSAIESIHQMNGSPKYSKCKIESAIPDLDPHRYALLHAGIEMIMDAALPLLASLRSPALLLPGPLQVVVKAQRIALEENNEYVGVWHDDGLRESIVAVVLYYYRLSESIQGGGLEFASKSGVEFDMEDVTTEESNIDNIRKAVGDLPRCIVEVNEGTMVVFNNYPMVHRVLRMVAEKSQGSRDFVALFIVDQKNPLNRPETLTPREERLARRHKMLTEQLKPRGHFGFSDEEVTCCGNGAFSDLKWIRSAYQYPLELFPEMWERLPGVEVGSWLNMTPPEMKRGASFLTSLGLPEVQFNPESSVEAHVVRVDGKEDEIFLVSYATKKYVIQSDADYFKSKGIRTVRLFPNKVEWDGVMTEFGIQQFKSRKRKSIDGNEG